MIRALAEAVGLAYRPAPEEAVAVLRAEPAPGRLVVGEAFTVRTWNVQFCGGRRHFWYDGGPDVHVAAPCVEHVADGARGADVLVLQEVDRGSDRTARVDQLPLLAEGFATVATTPYHRSRFVPLPVRRPTGRVEMHLVTATRYAAGPARRIALPPLREAPHRRAFNLRRAILELLVPLSDGRALAVGNVHLSAFSGGDGTLARQVAVVDAWMQAHDRAGRPWVLAGDLNLLPPGDDPSRLPDADQHTERAIAPLAERRRSAIPWDRALEPAYRTYQTYGSAPDRVLDYVLMSDDVEVDDARVEPNECSDHRAVFARLRVSGSPSA